MYLDWCVTHSQWRECYRSEGKCFWGYVIKGNATSAWFTSSLALEPWVDKWKVLLYWSHHTVRKPTLAHTLRTHTEVLRMYKEKWPASSHNRKLLILIIFYSILLIVILLLSSRPNISHIPTFHGTSKNPYICKLKFFFIDESNFSFID